MNEIELTPGDVQQIHLDAAHLNISPELLRYYVQFGIDAPTPPPPSRRGRRWLRRLGLP